MVQDMKDWHSHSFHPNSYFDIVSEFIATGPAYEQ